MNICGSYNWKQQDNDIWEKHRCGLEYGHPGKHKCFINIHDDVADINFTCNLEWEDS